MRRIVWRTLCRVARRAELWNGNRERWRNLFTWDQQESVISWAWHKHGPNRKRFAAAMADPANGHLTFVRLTSPRAVRRFVRDAEASSGQPVPGGSVPGGPVPGGSVPASGVDR
jgi:hypothetical protein